MSYDLGRSGGVESTRTIGLRRFHPVSPSDLTCMHGNFVSGRISGGCRQKIRWNVRSARTVVVGRTRGGGNFCEARRGRLPIGAVGTSLHRPSHTLVKLVCTSTYLPLPCWGTHRLRKFQTDEVELLGQRKGDALEAACVAQCAAPCRPRELPRDCAWQQWRVAWSILGGGYAGGQPVGHACGRADASAGESHQRPQ